MKVIDLLNKIANGKGIPQKIKWGCHILEWQVYHYVAIDDYGKPDFFELTHGISRFMLNDEVEVIEEEPRDIEVCGSLFTKSEYNKLFKEDKKIEKLDHKDFTNRFGAEEITDVKLVNKINEIIDKVNKGE